jgi:hypothetical protein
VKGREVKAVLSLTANDLSNAVGVLPEGKEDYLKMAVEALHLAIVSDMRKEEPSCELV